jgi:hypothetical protein
MIGYLMGMPEAPGTRTHLIVGVEDEPTDPTLARVFVGARYKGIYILADKEEAHRAWSGATHTYTTVPDTTEYYKEQQ